MYATQNGGWNPMGMMGTGNQYYGDPNAKKQMNTLTNEQIQKLMKKDNQFSLQITETERLKAICNHRTADGMGDALRETPDGLCTCQICGYSFLPLDASASSLEQVVEYTNCILDVLQTIKLIYVDLPPEAEQEFFQIIALIDKIPQLYEFALKNYAQHEQINPYSYNNRGMGALSIFNMLVGAGTQNMQAQMMNNGSNGFGYYGAPQQMPGYPQQGGMPPYGVPVPPNGGYVPNTDPNYSYDPAQSTVSAGNVQATAPSAQPESTSVAVTGNDTNVTANFKA